MRKNLRFTVSLILNTSVFLYICLRVSSKQTSLEFNLRWFYTELPTTQFVRHHAGVVSYDVLLFLRV